MKQITLTYQIYIAAMLLLLGLTACSSKEDIPQPELQPEQNDMPIRWSVQSEGMAEGRALIDNDAALRNACTSEIGGKSIGIWSAYEKAGELTEHVLRAPADVSLTYVYGTSWDNWEGWTYGEKAAYWTSDAVYYFNAYFPKEGGLTNISHTKTSLGGKYNAIETQEDIMVCRKVVDTGAANFQGSPVSLPMKHALATLQFLFQMEGESATNVLKSFSLDNTLKTSADLNYNTADITIGNWVNHQASSTNRIYAWSSDTGISFSATTSANPYIGNDNDGRIFIIPQSCATAPTFSFVSDLMSKEDVSIGTTTFEPGKHYIYTIKMKDNAVNVTLRIKAWNELNSSYDITF